MKGASAAEISEATELALSHGEAQVAKANKLVEITGVDFVHPSVRERSYLLPGEPLQIRVGFKTDGAIDDVVMGISVADVEGRVVFGWNTAMLDADISPLEGSGEVTFDFAQIPLLDGDYTVTVAAHTRDEGTVYDWHDEEYSFEVMNPGKGAGQVWAPATVHVSGSSVKVHTA